MPHPGLRFASAADVEAAAVTWLEVAEAVETDGATSFLFDFSWRAETIAAFQRGGPSCTTRSALCKTEVYGRRPLSALLNSAKLASRPGEVPDMT
jgi:hypothetical protein